MPQMNFSTSGNITSSKVDQSTVVLWLMTIIGLIALIENLILLLVIIKYAYSRHLGSQILVANLVFTFVLISFPLTLSLYDSDAKGHGLSPSLCTTLLFGLYVCLSASMWTNVCLGFNRVVAIFSPHKYGAITGRKFNVALVLFCWLLSFAIITPVPFLEGGRVHHPPRGLCLNYQTLDRRIDLLFMSFTVVPYALISAASLAVIAKSIQIHRNRQQQIRGDPSHYSKEFNQFSRRLHVAKMLFVSFIWNSTCQLPAFVAMMFFPDWFFGAPVASSWINCAIALEYAGNPLIFFAMSKDYREGLRQFVQRTPAYAHSSNAETQFSLSRRLIPSE